MGTQTLEAGVVLGFGGSNARVASCHGGDIYNFASVSTPPQPEALFGWMARQMLTAADRGEAWMVAGFPGPVSADGTKVGPLANVSGLRSRQYDLAASLSNADPAARRLLEDGFDLTAVNDGELAAQAAAHSVGKRAYAHVAALILGTGVGAGIVSRSTDNAAVYHAPLGMPTEIGHLPVKHDPTETFETTVSGTALTALYGCSPADMPPHHPAWRQVGRSVARMAMILGLMQGAELVVPCGGVGSGASQKYKHRLAEALEEYESSANATQKLFMPDISPVPPANCQTFEMFGAEGAMLAYRARRAQAPPVQG